MKALTLLLITLLSLSATSTACIVTGSVTDAMTMQRVAGALIFVPKSSVRAWAGIDGLFTLKMPKGTHRLKVAYFGYETKIVELKCDVDTVTMDIQLQLEQAQSEYIEISPMPSKEIGEAPPVSPRSCGANMEAKGISLGGQRPLVINGIRIDDPKHPDRFWKYSERKRSRIIKRVLIRKSSGK